MSRKILYIRENVCAKKSSAELERYTAELMSPIYLFFVVVNNHFQALEQMQMHDFDVIVMQAQFTEDHIEVEDFHRMLRAAATITVAAATDTTVAAGDGVPPILLLCKRGQLVQKVDPHSPQQQLYACVEEGICADRFLRDLCDAIKSAVGKTSEAAADNKLKSVAVIGSSDSTTALFGNHQQRSATPPPLPQRKRKFASAADSAQLAHKKTLAKRPRKQQQQKKKSPQQQQVLNESLDAELLDSLDNNDCSSSWQQLPELQLIDLHLLDADNPANCSNSSDFTSSCDGSSSTASINDCDFLYDIF